MMDGHRQLRGDKGLTDLVDVHDLPKSDLRFEVLGTLDEASAALGMARASSDASPRIWELILEIQHDLCWMMSELAIVSNEGRPESRITSDRLLALENAYQELTTAHPLSTAFALPGNSMAGASLHLARTVIRRAERHVTLLAQDAPLPNSNIIPYLNRLSTLVFAMAHAQEATSDALRPSLARSSEEDY